MQNLCLILTNLRAAIAAKAARDRTLTALLVLVWGRIARMGTRLERLFAQWRAGTLPKARKPRAGRTERTYTPGVRPSFPTAPGWLIVRVREATAFGSQLQHMLSDAEWVAFLAAVPQAGRILRPLCRMLLVDAVPAVLHKAPSPMAAAPVPVILPFEIAPTQVGDFLPV